MPASEDGCSRGAGGPLRGGRAGRRRVTQVSATFRSSASCALQQNKAATTALPSAVRRIHAQPEQSFKGRERSRRPVAQRLRMGRRVQPAVPPGSKHVPEQPSPPPPASVARPGLLRCHRRLVGGPVRLFRPRDLVLVIIRRRQDSASPGRPPAESRSAGRTGSRSRRRR